MKLDKETKIARKIIVGLAPEIEISINTIDSVTIIVEPWKSFSASTFNVNQGGVPHFSVAQIKNLLDRKHPNFILKATKQEEQQALEQDVIDCFGSKDGLIEQLKNIDKTGTFYAQVDNFKPYCDAYHIKNLNGFEIYVKFYVEKNNKQKSDFVVVVRCHRNRT